MHVDARKLPKDSLIEGDICIIGAGASGISMAMDLMGSGHKVILLEGGGFEYNSKIQELYKGETSGQKYYPIMATRMHMFGGTTGMWGGFCTPFDDIDFQKREWVSNSGWPITKKDLDPYYFKAIDILDLHSDDFQLDYWVKKYPKMESLSLNNNVVYDKMWQFSPPTRFGEKYKTPILEAKNIDLYTYSNVTEIKLNKDLHSVKELIISNLEGVTHKVRTKVFVLACGAIQNARILMNSDGQMEKGIGNQNDLVGRYFMEHIESKSSEFWLNSKISKEMYLHEWKKTIARAELALSEDSQRENRILNGTASFRPLASANNSYLFTDRVKSDDPILNKEQWKPSIWSKMQRKLSRELDLMESNIERAFELYVRMEQAPNPNSRIYLSMERDALGMRRANLNWELTSLEKDSIRTLFMIIGKEAGISNIGRIKLLEFLQDENDQSWPDFIIPGNHHMGTTRMSMDPKKGVVDENCKIHGVNNLYIAGSSCFPTSGAANPTFTIVALSLRLSNQLLKILKP